eukprot:6209152-Pleurochrysis_carterae.AAC.6
MQARTLHCAAQPSPRKTKQSKTQTRWNLRYFPCKLPLKGVAARACRRATAVGATSTTGNHPLLWRLGQV